MIDLNNDMTDLEDIQVSDQERDTALSALFEFNRKNYAMCNQQLQKLDKTLSNNLKLTHNKAIVDFYHSKCKNMDELKKTLHLLNSQMSNSESLKPADKCPICYNLAVILYQMHKPQSALKVLLKVQPFLDQIEESLAERSVLLLCELFLEAHRPSDALKLIDCMEARVQVTAETYKEVLEKINLKMKEFQKKLNYYKMRALLLIHSVQDIMVSDETCMENSFIRSRVLYLQGSANAHEELTKYCKPTNNDENLINGDATVKGTMNENIAVLAYNNIGVIEFSRGRFQLATRSLQQALSREFKPMKDLKEKLTGLDETMTSNSSQATSSDHDLSSNASGITHRYSLLYNLGVSLLFCGRARDAFECLLEPLHYQHNNPRLWLRIAECCIMVYQQMKAENKLPLVEGVYGKSAHKKIVLNNITPLKYACDDSQSHAIPSPTLEFAALCLKIVLNIIPKEDVISENFQPNYGISLRELSSLRNSALAASAFVCLCVGDCLLALEHAQTLLTQTEISEAHRMLGHLYCAEALVLMDKISEAIQHLEPDLLKGISTNLASDNNIKPPSKWEIKDVQMAKQIITYNLAVTLAIRGDFNRAKVLLHELKQDKRNTYTSMLYLYIELQLGNLDKVREIIRHNCPQYI